MHDATKALLGATGSSAKDISVFNSDPASFPAGLAVRHASVAGTLSLLKTAGMWAGISLGKSLSDTKKTAVARSGELIPILLDSESADGAVTITSYANLLSGGADTITVAGVAFVAQAGAAVLGEATFQAATSNNATAASLAAQINAHATSSALVTAAAVNAVVTITAKAGGTGGNSIGVSLTEGGSGTGATLSGLSGGNLSGGAAEYDYAVLGAVVYISDTTGKATESGSGSTASNAVYVSAALDGVQEDGTSVKVALVDMPGGL